jgi:hypothetical protein
MTLYYIQNLFRRARRAPSATDFLFNSRRAFKRKRACRKTANPFSALRSLNEK